MRSHSAPEMTLTVGVLVFPRWSVFLGGHQHVPGVHHVPEGRAGPLWLENPEPSLWVRDRISRKRDICPSPGHVGHTQEVPCP